MAVQVKKFDICMVLRREEFLMCWCYLRICGIAFLIICQGHLESWKCIILCFTG